MKKVQWRLIALTALVLGLIAGIVPIFMKSPEVLYSTMPLFMMFGIYYVTPKLQQDRLVNSFLTSFLTAVVALVVFFIYEFASFDSETATAALKAAVQQFAMMTIIISVFGAWFFVKVHEWSMKKRAQMDAKLAARRGEQKKQITRPNKKRYKKKKKK